MFFKRLSRSRSNSQSYVDSHHSQQDSKTSSQAYADDRYSTGDYEHVQRPLDSRQSNQAAPLTSSNFNTTTTTTTTTAADALSKETGGAMASMYSRPNAGPTEVQTGGSYGSPNMGAGVPGSAGGGSMSNGGAGGYGGGGGSSYGRGSNNAENIPPLANKPAEAAPDLLIQAFSQAVRPHLDKVESLEGEIADLRAYIDQLEQQRSEVHSWIDKRGLRPDVPPSIARQMDTASHASSPTHAAATLNAQLDRKITIVNFDLHRLQDDLNDSLPTPSFSACMLKFLPDISRLSALPSGPRFAFDLLLKLGGNLNSHGGLENGDEEDLAERRAFYARLDEAMVDVVKGRFREEGESWGVQREIKRIEKTGAYLRNWGVEPYFPRTLNVMREGAGQGGVGGVAQEGSLPGYN